MHVLFTRLYILCSCSYTVYLLALFGSILLGSFDQFDDSDEDDMSHLVSLFRTIIFFDIAVSNFL